MKKDELIVEVLRKDGPLTRSEVIDRIGRITGERYPEPTADTHLRKLKDHGRVSSKDGMYHYVSKHSTQESDYLIEGCNVLETLGGEIDCKKILRPFEPKVELGKSSLDPRRLYLVIEFNSKRVFFSIDKEASPVKFFVSRSGEKDENKKIFQWLGLRSVLLKLPVGKISSFKNEAETGHGLLTYKDNVFHFQDLNPTNNPIIIKSPGMCFDSFLKHRSLVSSRTVKEGGQPFTGVPEVEQKIFRSQKLILHDPFVLRLTPDCQIAFFF